MRIIVTGASGFVGRNFLLRAPRHWRITALYHRSKNFHQFLRDHSLTHVKAVRCDLRNTAQTIRFARKNNKPFDGCVYLAASSNPLLSVKNPLFDLESNTKAIINFLSATRIKRFVYVSSGAIYHGLKGRVSPQSAVTPQLPYAISKLSAEQYVKFFTKAGNIKEYIILRFFGAFGPYEPDRKIYTHLVKTFYKTHNLHFSVRGDGKNYIDAMYIDDAVRGILKVITSRKKDLTVDFCAGRPMTIDRLVQSAAKTFQKGSIRIEHHGRVPEHNLFYASPRAMQTIFGFCPRFSLAKGLNDFAKFLKKR